MKMVNFTAEWQPAFLMDILSLNPPGFFKELSHVVK